MTAPHSIAMTVTVSQQARQCDPETEAAKPNHGNINCHLQLPVKGPSVSRAHSKKVVVCNMGGRAQSQARVISLRMTTNECHLPRVYWMQNTHGNQQTYVKIVGESELSRKLQNSTAINPIAVEMFHSEPSSLNRSISSLEPCDYSTAKNPQTLKGNCTDAVTTHFFT